MKRIWLTLFFVLIVLVLSISNSVQALDVTASSGSPEDIQAAVDQVATGGGGTVYVPEGKFVFDYIGSVGVNVPGGVNVIGMGSDKTILNRTEIGGTMFYIDGSNDKPVRISGIHFFASVDPEETGSNPIRIYNTKDFRIDHNRFTNFPSGGGIVSNKHTGIHRGVIDHNVFNNPYKETGGSWQWSYGVNLQMTSAGRSSFGWKNLDYYLGNYDDNIVFIEDNIFVQCRYAVASNTGAWYVFRNNDVTVSPLYGSFGKAGVDVHEGSDTYWGGRGLESYNNIIRRGGDYGDQAFKLRGGSGVIHNNTIINIGTAVWLLKADWATEEQNYVHEMYIWGNNYQNVGTEISNPSGFYQENVHYFLRVPNLAQDGLEYEPYPYPHPLTLDGTIPNTTTTTTSTSTTTSTTTTTIPAGQVTISGQLRNSTNIIQANISVYNRGTNKINTSQVNSNGNYSFSIWPGIYDLQYKIFYIPNLFIKFISLNIASNLQNVVNYVNDLDNGVSFSVDISGNQEIQVYSGERPNRVLNNGILLQEVSSYSGLTSNTWYYDSIDDRLYIMANPIVTTTTTITTTIPVGLSKLHTDGAYIKDESDNTVFLRGVNKGGFVDTTTGQWRCQGCGLWEGVNTWSPDAVKENLNNMSQTWGMNVLRLHTSIEWWKTDNSSYRQHIKDTITWAEERGMYVIYDTYCVRYYPICVQQELPIPPYLNSTLGEDQIIKNEQDFIDLWENIADELKGHPNVIFEIYNEPHGGDTAKEKYFDISQRIIDVIRSTGADQPIIIQWDYGIWVNLDYPNSPHTDMSWVGNYPLNDPLDNLIYSTHLYRGNFHRTIGGRVNSWDYDEIKLGLQTCLVDYVTDTLNKPVLIGEIGANMWYSGEELNRELAFFNNSLSIFNEWELSYIDWVWTAPAHMRHGIVQNGIWIPPPNEAGEILIDKIAEG